MYVLGDMTLFAATIASLASALAYVLFWRGRPGLAGPARKLFASTTFLISAAMGILLYLILTHDYSVAYVYSYSSSDLPFGYLVATLWGGQEGTFLLWGFFTAVMGLFMMRTSGRFEPGCMFFLNLFMLSLLVILLKKSPFELLPVIAVDGAGLNPLLQNFWMQIHPPIMFLGFAGLVFPFCFALTGLVERKYDSWAESARRWTLFAWVSLGTSLVMGGYWAYETLGWGGFWAWDPVENSSFIPWIFLTAQVHTLFIKKRRQGLMRFSLFVVCLSFWSVLYGTFLTRSGVLADFSVHSFVDLGINQFLIGGMAFFVILGLFLLLMRWQDISPHPSFSKINSRSYLVTIGILVLFLGGVLTLLGTSAPLLTRLTGNPSDVGLSYYFATMTPVAVAVLLLLGLFPAFKWNDGLFRPKLLMWSGTASVFTVATLIVLKVTYEPIYLLLFGAAALALVANGFVLAYNFLYKNKISFAYLAHIGLVLALIGAAVSAGFESKQQVILPKGKKVEALGYHLRFVDTFQKPEGFDCRIEVSDADGESFLATLSHEFPHNSEGVMKKPHIERFFDHDFYLAPLALESTSIDDQGTFTLGKGESRTVDKYSITFHDFKLDSHGDEGPSQVNAELTITYDGVSEKVSPALIVAESGIEPVGVPFDYQRGTIFISGVRPDDNSVVLKVAGDFLPAPQSKATRLIVELSRKPAINLFWLGTFIMFLAGGMSMRRKKTNPRRSEKSSLSSREPKKVPLKRSRLAKT